jgi:aspartyl-tRNA(Asn)/glutamyl-tRNA(Gln) amidotransferase subunit A
MPTTPLTAPRLADLAADDSYRKVNFLMLRNPAIVNFLDCCSISLPCQRAGDAPVGLVLVGEHGADRRLLAIAAAIERVVSPSFA